MAPAIDPPLGESMRSRRAIIIAARYTQASPSFRAPRFYFIIPTSHRAAKAPTRIHGGHNSPRRRVSQCTESVYLSLIACAVRFRRRFRKKSHKGAVLGVSNYLLFINFARLTRKIKLSSQKLIEIIFSLLIF